MTDPRSPDSYDVKFLVGPKKYVVQANKFLLAGSSTVFHRMFYLDFPSESTVIVPDVDAKAFDLMIGTIYGRKFNIDETNIAHIFYAVDKYDLWVMRQICLNFVKNMITSTNALTVLNSYHCYNESDINGKCLSIILDDPLSFVGKPEFLEAPVAVARSICEPMEINCTTKDLKIALSKWMDNKGLIYSVYSESKWFQTVKNILKIEKEKLERKNMRQNLFQHFDHSTTMYSHSTTVIKLEKPRVFLHGIGLVVSKDTTVSITIKIAGKQENYCFEKIVEKKIRESSVSIQDVFFKKIPIFATPAELTVEISFINPDEGFRPCVLYKEKISFMSYLIISKMPEL
jgi:BTB/POZ domain